MHIHVHTNMNTIILMNFLNAHIIFGGCQKFSARNVIHKKSVLFVWQTSQWISVRFWVVKLIDSFTIVIRSGYRKKNLWQYHINLWQILLYKTEKLVLLTKLIFEHPLDSLHVSWKWSKESQLNLIDFYHEQILWSIVSSVMFWHYTGTDGCKFVYNVISYGIPANTVWQSLHTLTLYIYKHVTNFIKGW